MKHLWILACLSLAGCMSAAKHHQQLASSNDRALTLGLVQKEIRTGMSAADVSTALGSPNIVTGDSKQGETWIYDKVASEASFSQDSGNISGRASGGATFPGNGSYNAPSPSGSFSGDVGGGYFRSAGAASITQRTLTVIIKFNADHLVESVAYNSTRF